MRATAERKNEGVHYVNGNVLKFGGTSLGDAAALIKAAAIVRGDENARAVVVSAPGKRYFSDTKITDLLYDVASSHGASPSLFDIKNRFDEMIQTLCVDLDFGGEYDVIARAAKDGDTPLVVSRGEYLSAKITAKYMGFDFIDAADVIRFDARGALDKDATFSLIRAALGGKNRAVIPGFYGADENGKIAVFPRGGSDITGAVVSAALGADYFNYTDVSGFMYIDPKYTDAPRPIEALSYGEAIFLASYGAGVLHADAARYARDAGVKIHVKNTFSPSDAGTLITVRSPHGASVYGVSGVYGFFGDRSAVAVGCRGGDVATDALGDDARLEKVEPCGAVFSVPNEEFERTIRAFK